MSRSFLALAALALFLLTLLSACRQNEPAAEIARDAATTSDVPKGPYYGEPHRPQVHFSPERGWMNDPNGLVFVDGQYHLFYQYYPDSTVWGPMHWGHAVSKDLLNWAHYPIALAPVDSNYVFSGSIVYDALNTSGFGTTAQPPLVALYTNHDMVAERKGAKDYETQALAYSLDGGTTWTRHSANPVLANPGLKDFRDPKVTWHEPTKRWIMALAARDIVKFYTSPDLKAWTFASDFGAGVGSHGGIWECPDLFRIVESTTGRERYVLIVSVQDGAPAGGSGTSYFVGDFDGTHFTATAGAKTPLWLDQGADHYAFVTFDHSPLPDKQRVGIAWMSNWKYAQQVPATTWRSAMTSARVLSLYETSAGPRLKVLPVPEYYKIRQGRVQFRRLTNLVPTDLSASLDNLGGPIEMSLSTPRGEVPNFSVEITSAEGDTLSFGYDSVATQFFIDRSKINSKAWSPEFAARHTMSNQKLTRIENLRILVDASSVEIFADDGYAVMTDVFFLGGTRTGMRLLGSAGIMGTVHLLAPTLPTPLSATQASLGTK